MLSVVICTYNRSKKLHRVLNDILDNPINENIDFELIVVDNNSTDDTKSVVDEFVSSNSTNLRYIFESAQGLSNARNRGIREARGEWICFTDDDVRLDKKWLASISSAIKCNPKMDAYGGRIKEQWVEDPPDWFILEGECAMTGGGAIVFFDLGKEAQNLNEKKISPIGANMGFKKEVFEKVGLFNPDFGKKGDDQGLGDDVEFCTRVRNEGFLTLYLPEPLVWHEVESTRLTVPSMKRFYYELGYRRGRGKMFPRHTKWLFGAPRYLFKEFVTSILRSLGYRIFDLGKSRYYMFNFHYIRGLLKGCYEKEQ